MVDIQSAMGEIRQGKINKEGKKKKKGRNHRGKI